jgi:uncharacterized membrane protein SpoIIM required for sporulation
VLGSVLALQGGHPGRGNAGTSSAWSLFVHNALISLLLSSGVITLGLTAGLVLLENGAVFAYTVIGAARSRPPWKVFLTLLPHAPIEIFATIVAGGAGFISLRLLVDKLDGKKGLICRRALADFGIMAMGSLVLLLPAALLESFVSARIAS